VVGSLLGAWPSGSDGVSTGQITKNQANHPVFLQNSGFKLFRKSRLVAKESGRRGNDPVRIMLAPVAAALAADLKITANSRAIFMMLATPGLHVKPVTDSVQILACWFLIGRDKGQQIIPQIVWHGVPIDRVERLVSGVHKGWVTHVHTTDTAAFTICDHG